MVESDAGLSCYSQHNADLERNLKQRQRGIFEVHSVDQYHLISFQVDFKDRTVGWDEESLLGYFLGEWFNFVEIIAEHDDFFETVNNLEAYNVVESGGVLLRDLEQSEKLNGTGINWEHDDVLFLDLVWNYLESMRVRLRDLVVVGVADLVISLLGDFLGLAEDCLVGRVFNVGLTFLNWLLLIDSVRLDYEGVSFLIISVKL